MAQKEQPTQTQCWTPTHVIDLTINQNSYQFNVGWMSTTTTQEKQAEKVYCCGCQDLCHPKHTSKCQTCNKKFCVICIADGLIDCKKCQKTHCFDCAARRWCAKHKTCGTGCPKCEEEQDKVGTWKKTRYVYR